LVKRKKDQLNQDEIVNMNGAVCYSMNFDVVDDILVLFTYQSNLLLI